MTSKSPTTRIVIGVLLPAVLGATAAVQLAHALETGTADPPIDFDTRIQPLLAGRCVQCHGPGTAEAGLRLDVAAGALAALESGNRAIVPGWAQESALVMRIRADGEERMPPHGKPLEPAEIAALERWITQGAPWPEHWAYRPLTLPPVPPLADGQAAGWPRNPIDHFILRTLAEHDLGPAPEADRRTLLRRLSFDLIGLPPTPAELDAFLADDAPDAWERIVDRLLASPHFGERWARHWMDVVHYADSHGFEHDLPREIWPYRDYLVRSFNDDKPYARFVREQVAGDALHPGDVDALVATGFLATGPWDLSALQAGNADSIDHEISQYLDRDDIVSTVISTFVSTTVHCARCHDHKFDPVTQEDYYGLQAVFAGIDKAHRPYDPDPEVGRQRDALVARRAELSRMKEAADAALLAPDLEAEVAAWGAAHARAATAWVTPTVVEARADAATVLVPQPDGSCLATGDRPDKDVYTFVLDVPLPGITAVRLEVLTDETLPHQGPGRQENGNLHLSEVVVTAAPLADPSRRRPVTVAAATADFNQGGGWSIDRAIDGNPATAWGIYPAVGRPHEARFDLAEPLGHPGGTRLTVELRQLHGGGHLIGRPRLSVTDVAPSLLAEAGTLPAEVAAALGRPPEERDDRQRAILAAAYLDRTITAELAALPAQKKIYCGTNRFEPTGGLRPAPAPRPIHVLARGEITQPGAPATPGTLSCVPGLPSRFELDDPADEARRRVALAEWLARDDNVLTWRSIANRVWQYHIGRGLVTTPNDFGRMGAAPSHPELLDWLAVSLRESGGSLKSLHRLIVTSAAYRQASRHVPEHAAIDGDNRLLWRMNRRRLDAESVRDAILAVAGTLDPALGGPPVEHFVRGRTFNLRPEADYAAYDRDAPGATRRSIYRYHFRTIPDPLMDALDCPDGTALAPTRTESVTALQALAVKNDPFVIRQAERLAARLEAEAPDAAARIALAYRRLFGRRPSAHELEAVLDYTRRFGLANACRMLLNTNEFLFID
jgi:mono/diheme cytochrome c family protein